jgi:hypothetical protein
LTPFGGKKETQRPGKKRGVEPGYAFEDVASKQGLKLSNSIPGNQVI